MHPLKRARKLKVMTQRELAEAAGVEIKTVSRIERGKDARPKTLKKLAAALGVEPSTLVNLD